MSLLNAALLGLLVLNAVLLLVLLFRRAPASDMSVFTGRLENLDRGQERGERAVREEIARNREQITGDARALREEVSGSVQGLGQNVLQQLGVLSQEQQTKLDQVFTGLQQLSEGSQRHAAHLRTEVGTVLKQGSDTTLQAMGKLAEFQKQQLDGVVTQVTQLSAANETRFETLRTAVEGKLQLIREDNTKQLEEMRKTVDEKLQGALERRLGEQFNLVSQRLEEVHKGLGEMQTLASGVGDLKRVLTNVKVRGTWGEVQLGNLLEQVLAPEQWAANVALRAGSAERVEYAIRLPGRGEQENEVVWLPVDSKFPMEDYQRLVEAQERGDLTQAEEAGRGLEAAVRKCAADICTKYICPPATTDFGIMFLPTEGLFAETIRRPGLVEAIQRDCRVIVAGPTTLAALLNSLQMGFRTLAVQKRSSEVWKVLGAVKTEFGKFGGVLDKVQKKLQEASNTMDAAAQRTRVMERTLRDVEALPAADATLLLGSSVVIVGED
jgi:DNA recombination protein RmuC